MPTFVQALATTVAEVSMCWLALSHDFSQPDVGAAVSTRVSDFVGQHWTIWLCPKVHIEIGIDLQAPLDVVHVDLQEIGAMLSHARVELLVPGCEQGVGDIQALPVQTA